jgi:hypothetical protein
MYEKAPQLWRKHEGSDVVNVSEDEPGETFRGLRMGFA